MTARGMENMPGKIKNFYKKNNIFGKKNLLGTVYRNMFKI